MTNINKEPARTWFLPYSCRCNALSGARILNGHTPESAYAGIISEKSSRRKLLNGDWSFIPDSEQNETNENRQTIKVPGNNNAGIYKREFALPSAWTGRDVFINFDGVGGFFYVYINDEFAGASEATFSPAEINITPLLKAGNNTVTVIVLKQNADKSEGIFRDVYLLARTHEHIKDINIKTNLDTIYIEVFASKENGAATVELYDDNNQLLIRKDSIIKESKASFEIKVENPINWTPEKPYLYTALIHGFNEVIPQRIALRTITQSSDDNCSINGNPVTLKSINDIFFESPCPLNSILSELLLLKMHNINCLQIHKNNATAALLNLCDEIGFIVDCTSTETPCARRNDISELSVLSAAYSPVSAKAHEMTFTKQTYAFTNHTDFTNLEEFDIAYIIKTPSQVFAQGVLNINCAPHETVCESIDFTFPEFSFEEFFIEFKYKLKKDTVWAHAGFPIGFDQIKLPVLQTIPETETTTSMPPMSIYFSEPNEKGIMTVEGEDFTYSFDMTKGTFTSLVFNAVEMLKNAPQFSIDKESVQQAHFCKVLSKGSKYVTILASYSINTPKAAASVNFSVLWAIYGSGEIGVGVTAEVPTETPALSRFGFDVMMPADKNFIRYYGYGPFSSYYNLKNHCKKGIYQANVAGRTSNHFGVQWAIVHDFQGRGIMFKGMPEFQLGLLDDVIKIDYKRTDIDGKQFLYSFTIKPIFTECTDILRESRTLPGIMEV